VFATECGEVDLAAFRIQFMVFANTIRVYDILSELNINNEDRYRKKLRNKEMARKIKYRKKTVVKINRMKI